MSYDKLDKSITASYRRGRKARIENGLKVLFIIVFLNLSIFGAVIFALKASSNEVVAAETPVVVADSAAVVMLEDGGDLLTVQLDNNLIDGYEWKYGVSDSNKIREVRSFENTTVYEREIDAASNGRWTVSFEPTEIGNGDVELNFFYVKDRETSSIYTKTINIRINDSFDFEVIS